jgi:hypothetical protein
MPIILPLVSTPGQELFYPPVFNFFLKYILIVQGDFALALQAYVYHSLNKLTPTLLTLSVTMLP